MLKRVSLTEGNDSPFKLLEVTQVVLNNAVDAFRIKLPVEVNQPIPEFCHLLKSVDKIRIEDPNPAQLPKDAGIGLWRGHRFLKLIQGQKTVADVEAALDSQLEKPFRTCLQDVIFNKLLHRLLLHLKEMLIVAIQVFEMIYDSFIHNDSGYQASDSSLCSRKTT